MWRFAIPLLLRRLLAHAFFQFSPHENAAHLPSLYLYLAARHAAFRSYYLPATTRALSAATAITTMRWPVTLLVLANLGSLPLPLYRAFLSRHGCLHLPTSLRLPTHAAHGLLKEMTAAGRRHAAPPVSVPPCLALWFFCVALPCGAAIRNLMVRGR